jgi:hypothetical protein
MRKLFLLLSACAIALVADAKHVSLKDASTVGLNFYKNITNQRNAAIDANHFATNAGTPANAVYYVFDVVPTGFVIVAADDRAEPILGYSSEVNWTAPVADRELDFWMNKYVTQLNDIITNDIAATPEITTKWNQYLNNTISRAKAGNSIAPLCKTTWNQNPYYNDLCPFDATANALSVTGCVATAQAQILKYWNWPITGTSSHTYGSNYGNLTANFANTTYDWSKMPNYINLANTQIATLMSHCGIAVNMNYSPTSSGAYTTTGNNSALHAYSAYFKYNAAKVKAASQSSYSVNQWIALLEGELNLRRPMQYSGRTSTSGHSWVCDGYDVNDNFHMNWGWGGMSNGYFTIGALNPAALGTGGGTGGGFNQSDDVIMGVEPNNDAYEVGSTPNGVYNFPLSFNGNTASAVTNIATINKMNDTDYYHFDLPVGFDYLVKSQVNDKYYNQSVGGFTIDVDVLYNVGNSWWNGSFDNYIDSFTIHGGQALDYMVYPYTQYSMGSYQLNVQVLRTGANGVEDISSNLNFNISPNPAQNNIVVSGLNLNTSTIQITNALGEQLNSSNLVNKTSENIDISNLSNGIYFISIKNNYGTLTKKFVINR